MTAPTIPTDASELETLLADPERLNATVSAGQLKDVIRSYASSQMASQVAKTVQEETQLQLANWLKDNGQNLKRPDLSPKAVATRTGVASKIYNPAAVGAQLDEHFASSAEYFTTIWHKAQPTAGVVERRAALQNVMTTTVPSDGGFLVPERLRSELLRLSLETAIVRPRARVIPMEAPRVPFPAVDSTTNVGSLYGGIVCYWTEEGATLTASQPSFARVVLDAKKLTALTEMTNEMLADSIISMQAFVDDVFPEALGFEEDYAFLTGSGVGQPLGVFNAAATITVTKEVGQAASTIVWENIVKMYSRMLPQSLNRGVWIVAPNTFSELATMALSVGTGGSAIWLTNGVAGPPMSILGRPVIVSEKAAALGTIHDINFIDFGFYLIGDRQAMTAASSEHVAFTRDSTVFRIIERLDGRPWLLSDITPRNGGPTLSPFVTLETR